MQEPMETSCIPRAASPLSAVSTVSPGGIGVCGMAYRGIFSRGNDTKPACNGAAGCTACVPAAGPTVTGVRGAAVVAPAVGLGAAPAGGVGAGLNAAGDC